MIHLVGVVSGQTELPSFRRGTGEREEAMDDASGGAFLLVFPSEPADERGGNG